MVNDTEQIIKFYIKNREKTLKFAKNIKHFIIFSVFLYEQTYTNGEL